MIFVTGKTDFDQCFYLGILLEKPLELGKITLSLIRSKNEES